VNETATFARPEAKSRPEDDGLEVRSIAKSYDKRAVLHDVSLKVHRGEVVGLLGPNGAGKTTCFYSVMGLVKPDSGRIYLDGADITELPMYRRAILGLGYLPQETSIFRGMTVAENIIAVLETAEPDAQLRRDRLEQLLSEFGLTALRDSPAMALSGGERRRCEIARALAAHPSIMLLDEPFAGIDPISISDIRELVRELKSREIGVLITDHNVRETLDIVDRACIIYDGQVLFQGTPEALVADQEVRRLYLGESFAL
jgi:lipopolysaccharide export system ATP-binding protein